MEYLSDGITEAIINTLSQLPRLRVMARSTVFRYKGRPQEPQDIGRDLNVRAVLTGRVLHRGDMIVIGRSQQLDPLSLIVAHRQVIQTDPTFSRVWFDLGLTLAATGAYDQAIQERKKAGRQPFAVMLTSIAQALAGQRDRAAAAISRLEEYARAGTIGNDELAMVYTAVGESRRASELLQRACDERAPALAYAAVEPLMEFLRNDAECGPVLERAGLIAPVPPEGPRG